MKNSYIKTLKIKNVIHLVISFLILTNSAFASNNQDKPNFLFILTDDQAYTAMGNAGNHQIKTPNLDQLAASGTKFTHVFNQGSWSPAVCAPSRAMINTGRNLYHTGMKDKSIATQARPEHPLWGETFKNAGYDTFMTGKWHVSRQALLRSFTSGKAIHEGGMTYDHYNATMVNLDEKTHQLSAPYPSKKHTSELIADAAVDYLQQKPKRNDAPFLMYVGFLAPHDARQSPQSYVDMYPGKNINLPKSYLKQNTVDQGDFWVRDEILLPIPRKEEPVKQFIGEYYAMITHMDAQIGRILDSLESSPYADNTIVVFTSDHGLAVGKHGLLGKQNQYDHSIRAPFIIAGKGIEQGKVSKGNFYLNSLFPTTAELAGIEVPATVQAKSIVPLLSEQGMSDQKSGLYDYIYGSYRHYQRMVRTDDFKLIYYPMIKQTQLFDLKNDPEELNNLAADPNYHEQLVMLQSKLIDLMKELDDPLDFNAPAQSFKKAGYAIIPWRKNDKRLN
ncbi:sulfatase-like hydrolase/transferase [Thalassotalea nanhaiensis]|uniref:Sulfatase-like hydrolase/transferase n=1 Tax=Thalassotalea nanhaiensis TaxID=3065648 RepID=A0ABY9TKB3_9GAMM|nr:sulfatase-like hydrolase/transferase [Colwelliaceae bacterium SQ345]